MELFDKLVGLFSRGSGAQQLDERPPIRLENPFRRRDHAAVSDGQPRFRASATPRSEDSDSEAVRHRLREAFVPSQPVHSRTMFAGRVRLLEQLIQAIEDQRAHVVLYGERGIGKTSLLRVFTEAARDADYLVLHENCGSGSQFEELFRGICEQIPLLYYGALPPVETQAREGASLADVLPAGQAGASHVARVLVEVKGTRLIIILDEFDRAESADFQRGVAELIKNLSDASARVQLVIAGVADNLQDLLGHSPSIRRNIIGMSVERMTEQEVEEIIAIGERHTALEFRPAARVAIVSSAQGFPYLARLLCHHASIAAVTSGRRKVERADVQHALDQSLREMEARLPKDTRAAARSWLAAEPRAMFEIARAGINGGGSFELADIGKGGKGAMDEARQLVERLMQSQEILVPSGGGSERYKLSEEGLASYLLLATSAGTEDGAAGKVRAG